MFFGPGGSGGMPPGGGQAFNPLQAMFGGFGGSGPGGSGGLQVDATLIENLFGPGAAYGFPGNFDGGFPGQFDVGGASGSGAGDAPRSTAPPPTSKQMYRNLPRVKVSAYDIEHNESDECSICLDNLVIGQPAIRIPCGHLYHEDCIEDWLKKSNECPVCRWELPTDDVEYERGRRTRMAGRKIRLRQADFAAKSAAELRRLAVFLKIDVTGCLEKSELVERITAAEQVEIVDAAPAAASNCASSTAARASEDLPSVSASSGASPSNRTQPDTSTHAPPGDQQPLEKQSVTQLRNLAKGIGVSLTGCLEKSDIIRCIRESPNYSEP